MIFPSQCNLFEPGCGLEIDILRAYIVVDDLVQRDEETSIHSFEIS